MEFRVWVLELLHALPLLFLLQASAEANHGNLKYLYSRVSPGIQEDAAQDVVKRILPNRSSEFVIKVDRNLSNSRYKDAFEIYWDEEEEKVVIAGTTGVSALFGFNFYLKYYCDAHIAWEGSQLNLPKPLPKLPTRIKKDILDRFRYYENVCTESYSFVWWEWDRWEREIDWMALNGINLPLAFTGQEAIWESVYLKLGLSQAQIQSYVSGPGFLAWWRMGNIQKWAGPLPKLYSKKKLQILQKILNRMRNLGMVPVLPAFAGNVPPGLAQLYPNSTFERHPSWNGFNHTYSRTYMLDPMDPLFRKIGKLFVKELIATVGTNHIYSSDPYNENRPAHKDTKFLRSVSKAIFKSMMAADPKAVWMIQGWVFTDFEFWTKDLVKAFLKGVQRGNLVVLDLQAESLPLFLSLDYFFHHAFIWCMLHNFGGTMTLYGNMDTIDKMLPEARRLASNESFVGIGLTPEGINQNYVMYDFMTEMALHSHSINTQKWITHYSRRRYGTPSKYLEKAWRLLQKGVYNNDEPGYRNHGNAILTHRPKINHTETFWYNPDDISVAVSYFLKEGSTPHSPVLNSSLYFHDLVDLTRQFLVNLGGFLYQELMKAYNEKTIRSFWKAGVELLQVIEELETILGTNERYLLGKWIHDAVQWSQNDAEKELLRYNSLVQITTWGPSTELLDYASKEWAGIASHYWKPRWTLFLDALENSFLSQEPFNLTLFNRKVWSQVEVPFARCGTQFRLDPRGNTFEEAMRIYQTWKQKYKTGMQRAEVSRAQFIGQAPDFYVGRKMKNIYGSISKVQQWLKDEQNNIV